MHSSLARFAELWVSGEKETAPETLVDLLIHAAESHHLTPSSSPSSSPSLTSTSLSNPSLLEYKSFSWLNENGVITQSLTYKELDTAARALAVLLIQHSAVGQPVLLLFEPGLDFLIGFFGCIYAGAIAVPLCPPTTSKDFSKLDNTILDCDPKLALTTSFLNRQIHIQLFNPFTKGGFGLKKLAFISVDEVDMELATKWTRPNVSSNGVAYIQYTSGSTSFPKGVLVTHQNAIYNSLAIAKSTNTSSECLSLCWLPLFHDMGLVGNIFSVMHYGMRAILMSPLSFLKRPEVFMLLLSQFKITHVSAPNFAYEFCVRKIPDSLIPSINLSHVKVALNASEPILSSTLQRFCDKFAPCGFTMEKFYPCYGLAEATLLVTAPKHTTKPYLHTTTDDRFFSKVGSLVGCGKSLNEGQIRIVDPDSKKEKKTLQVGEIWVSSPSVCAGYYNNPTKTKEVFGARIVDESGKESADTFLKTGDLGFVNQEGELFITGRQKDVILIRGKNLYPQDLEWLMQTSHSLVRPGSCVAFTHGTDSIVLLAEVRRELSPSERSFVTTDIKQAIAENFNGLRIHDVCLMKAGTIPKTTSGKVMRFACKMNYESGSITRLKDKAPSLLDMVKSFPSKVVDKFVQIIVPQHELNKEYVQKYLVTKIAEQTNSKQDKIDVHDDVRTYGFDSIRQMQLIRELEDKLGCRLPATLLDLFPTIEQLSDFLINEHPNKISPSLFPEGPADEKNIAVEAKKQAVVENSVQHSLGELGEPEPIVVVGMACRVPQARNVEQFWDNLVNGVDAITKVPADRWDADAFFDPDSDKPGKIPTTQGGFVDDIDKFDAAFFQIGPREAEVMDPQQRQILEVTYESLESAGITKEKMKGTPTGVFMGACFSDYHKIQTADHEEIRPYVQTGCAHSVIANRISYFFDLRGPSFSVDTACSSSLVALHLAAQSIRNGEISTAIVGGTSANLVPEMFMAFAKLHMLSSDGRCKAFDASGNGYVRSEGFCVLVIKPISKAIADGDPIRAVIRATGTNQDGKTSGLTFPGREAQEALLRDVYSKAKIKPQDIQYIEAHGTGTKAGDPVEVGAVGTVLGAARDRQEVALCIGSVKSNIGHLEGASGLAGIIKTVVAMEKGIIPGNLHFQTPNPDIDFDGMHLSVVSKTIPWPTCDIKRAGINSFGFGGSNAHIVVEQYGLPLSPSKLPMLNQIYPFVFSAHTKQATEQLIAAFHDKLAKEENNPEALRNIAYTLACRRTHYSTRASVVSNSKEDLITQLQTLKVSKAETTEERKILFVFTGQGAQYFAMGRELLKENLLFLHTMRQCELIIKKHMHWSLLEELAKSETESIIGRPDISQPACTALQISLVKVWESYGVKASVVVGHSSGEIAAAYCAGILSLEEAMKAAIARGIALRDTPSTIAGKMAAVSITDQEATILINSAPYSDKINIAAVNSPGNVTLSGNAAEIDEIVAAMKEKGVFAQVLRTERAYHSHHMTQVGMMLKSLLHDTKPAALSSLPMVSSVTGQLVDATEVDGTYWMRNLTGTVKFAAALQHAAKQYGCHAIVEVGPHPALAGPTRQSLTGVLPTVPPILPTICRKEPETRRMLLTACALGDIGYTINWDSLFPKNSNPKVVPNLPTLPWQGKSYWHEAISSKMRRFPEQSHELLGARASHAHGAWINSLRLDVVDYLIDHCVQGSIVFPGAGYIAMMIAASGSSHTVFLEDVAFKSALVFSDKDTPRKTQVALNSSPAKPHTSVSVSSENDKQEWQEHCSGKFSLTGPSAALPEFNSWKDKCTEYTSKEEAYKTFNQMGLEYGPNFQGIDEMWRGSLEAYAYISAPDSAVNRRESKSYLLHPTILDASFQTLIGCVMNLSGSYLPTKIAKINVLRPCHYSRYVVHAICTQANAQTITGNISIFTPEGLEICAVQGLLCTSIGGGKKTEKGETSWTNAAYETTWLEDASLCTWKDVVSNAGLKWDPLPDNLATLGVHKAYHAIKSANARILPQHAKLFSWIEEFINSSTVPKEQLEYDVDSINPEVVVTSRFCLELENILLGKTDPLSVMFGDEVIYDVYGKGPTFSGASESIRKVLPYLVHKDCKANILEIGGGTGGTTGHALRVLNNRFSSYTFTDISASFFEKAKLKFSNSVHKMVFRPLDIESDTTAQGFEENSYDVIIATDVLHATSDIVITLKNVHKLLKPGGILLMNEFVNCPVWIQTVFGTLDGWWKFVDKERRTMGPTLSEEGWVTALKDAGFAEQSVLHDYAPPLHGTFLAKKESPKQMHVDAWYILPDQSEVASALAGLLNKGVQGSGAPKAVVVSSAKDIPTKAHVLYLASLAPTIFNDVSSPVLDDMQQIAAQSTRVIWVTSGAAMDVHAPTLAPIVGLARVLRNEYPQLLSHTIDLDPTASLQDRVQTLQTLLLSHLSTFDVENEIAVRSARYYIPRLVPAQVSTDAKTSEKLLGEANVKLQIGTPGLLNSLQWVECDNMEVGDDEVELRVSATGVNFKDVMLAMGMLNKEAVEGGFCGEKLGIECAGVVTKVGANATNLAVGDRVVTVAKNSYSTYARTPSCLAVKIPSTMSFEEAATIPATFLTAMYALYYLARLEKGETVLIHAAAGGVGQAAIQLCQLVGAKVFVTAGSDEKRKFLQTEFNIPSDQIMSSRTLDFAEQIKTKTGGKGVDVVLNSLAGEFLFKSMSIVAPFGRFLEIGKRDIYSNSKLDMEPFGMNVSFFAIDLDRLNAAKPQIAGKMFRDLMKLFEDGKLKPMPFKAYPVSKVEEAFRFLQQGKNIGKVIVSVDLAEKIEVVSLPKSLSLKADGIYLLVGGMGGFGRSIATWMAEKGAKKMAFVSRSGSSTPAAKQLLQELHNAYPDLQVVVEAADVADYTQLQKAITNIRSAFNNSPIVGAIQMAMVLEDIMFDKIDADTFNKVVRPKAVGTQNLERLVGEKESPLDFFVMFSSVSSVVGNFGQSSYASANAYLDALAAQRKAQGLPGTSINWGAIGDVGYVAERKDLQEAMLRRGISTLSLAHALSALEYSIVHQLTQVVVAPMQWSLASNSLPALASRHFSHAQQSQENDRVGPNASESNAQEHVTGRARALAADPAQRADVVREVVREKLGAMLGVAGEDVEPSKKISELGVDSLMAIEVKNWVDKEFSVQVSVLDLTGGKSVDDLAAKISTSLSTSSPSPGPLTSSSGDGKPYVCIKHVEQPKQRVVCFPYLGGSASVFNSWGDLVPKDVEVWAWEPSAISEWGDLVKHLTADDISIFGNAKIPVTFYGHSLGALVAFEVACRLQDQGKPVAAIITGACGSPDQPAAFAKISEQWNDAALLALMPEVLTIGLLQAGIVESTTLGFEVLRAEIFLGRRYAAWSGVAKKFAGPLVALFGTNDLIISNTNSADSWRSFGTSFHSHLIPGGHLFIHDQSPHVVDLVSQTLLQ